MKLIHWKNEFPPTLKYGINPSVITGFESYKVILQLFLRNLSIARWWCHMPLIPALGRIFGFSANLVYRANAGTARAVQRKPVLKNKQNETSPSSSFVLLKKIIFIFHLHALCAPHAHLVSAEVRRGHLILYN